LILRLRPFWKRSTVFFTSLLSKNGSLCHLLLFRGSFTNFLSYRELLSRFLPYLERMPSHRSQLIHPPLPAFPYLSGSVPPFGPRCPIFPPFHTTTCFLRFLYFWGTQVSPLFRSRLSFGSFFESGTYSLQTSSLIPVGLWETDFANAEAAFLLANLRTFSPPPYVLTFHPSSAAPGLIGFLTFFLPLPGDRYLFPSLSPDRDVFPTSAGNASLVPMVITNRRPR